MQDVDWALVVVVSPPDALLSLPHVQHLNEGMEHNALGSICSLIRRASKAATYVF